MPVTCTQLLACGHRCCGIAGEFPCLPCLYCKPTTDGSSRMKVKQNANDMCMICFEDRLETRACVQNAACTHVFHYQCVRRILQTRWTGPRITFAFLCCPICKANISIHPALADLLQPCLDLYNTLVQKALTRLQYDGLSEAAEFQDPANRYFKDPVGFALNRYAYYLCYRCGRPYFGGESRCNIEMLMDGASDDFDPSELVCGSCSDVAQAQVIKSRISFG